MQARYILVGVVLGVLLSSVVVVLAGSLDPPSGPIGATSQMHTLEQIYRRLDGGTVTTKMTSFSEPANGPGSGTMHTLDEIYDLIGQRAPVPKTWQSMCYTDGPNSEQECPIRLYPGQDGDHQTGVAWPQPRFTDNGNGTVRDNLTGLIWLKNADCGGEALDWAGALSQVAQLNWDGEMNGIGCGDISNRGSHQTDWRLPNVRELQSLIHYGLAGPAVPDASGTGQWTPGDPFINVRGNPYWSGSTYVGTHSHGWYVGMGDGKVQHDLKSGEGYVWPVRGGH